MTHRFKQPGEMMNQLIVITQQTINDAQVQAVNARELHAHLESKQDFSTWIKSRIDQYGFVENVDYVRLHKKMEANNATLVDYFITLDMAKELSMVERNAKGKQARQYFISCEREAKALPSTKPRAPRLQAPEREAMSIFTPALRIAKLCGLTGNQALLAADKASIKTTGISTLSLIGQTHLIADQRGLTFTPTELGKERGISAQSMNKLLSASGLQKSNQKTSAWEPTDLGLKHCEWLDTGKKSSSGTPVKQLKWFVSACDHLILSNVA